MTEFKIGDKVWVKGVINQIDKGNVWDLYISTRENGVWIDSCLDECIPQNDTDEKPRYLRNVLARLRGLPEHDRKVWMDEIMHEFANDYGVEQERRYKAVLPNLYEEENVLHFSQEDEVWYFNHDFNDNVSVDKDSRYHTRKELEDAGFGWVFDCEGVEVQEVE
ncbi:DUF1642 domain-containing protein [Streptococcus intermedius]|uniref:DUF1642 domain-containing protein n=1 Tax=Streptococcus intermedius TaxID=1338 RepID=UPI000E3EB2B7|nr:DUF1642 domain-containing protein [Streptococcus intermedius]